MTSLFLTAIAAPLALQAAPPVTTEPSPPRSDLASIDELPIEQAAASRCGIAFAVVRRWQNDGDPRGSEYPDMDENGGREFFVRTMASLMESSELTREQVRYLIFQEVSALNNAEGEQQVEAIMPACLLMKQAAGL